MKEENMSDLSQKSCLPCEGGVAPMTKTQVQKLLKEIPQWTVDARGDQFISRKFEFKNFYQTMAFANAIAWIANTENHHPDLELSYKTCLVRYSTHAIQGLSENDFICAAKIDLLINR
jgi:4a-hydroxytetrahydrobiopterin dehydratase